MAENDKQDNDDSSSTMTTPPLPPHPPPPPNGGDEPMNNGNEPPPYLATVPETDDRRQLAARSNSVLREFIVDKIKRSNLRRPDYNQIRNRDNEEEAIVPVGLNNNNNE